MKNLGQKIYILGFFIILSLPTIGFFFDWDDYDSCENRQKVKLQEFEFSTKYVDTLQDYYKDHLGYKQRMSNWNASIKYDLFASSLHPSKSVVGKNGFLFYTSKDDLSYESYTKSKVLSEEYLSNLVVTHNKRKKYLDSLGIEYSIAFWPSKSTIYSENIPNRLKLQIENNSSEISQITEYLIKNNDNIQLINPTQKLLSLKNKFQLYRKYDTHWNNRGAFYAYQEILLALGLSPYKMKDFDITENTITTGDLLGLSGLCNSDANTEIDEDFALMNTYIWEVEKDNEKWIHMKSKNPTSDKKILIFRDSFGSALIQFISLHFPDTYFVWSDYNEELIKSINPDIIIAAKTERYF